MRGGKKRLGEKGVDDDVDTIVNFEGKGMKKRIEWANIHDKILPREGRSQVSVI